MSIDKIKSMSFFFFLKHLQQTLHCYRVPLSNMHRDIFLHLEMFNGNVNSSSSSSIEMEKYSEIRKGL